MRSSAGYFIFLGIVSINWFDCHRTVLAQLETEQTAPEQRTLAEVSPEQLPYKYCGNSFSHKFHRPTCPFGMCISKHHLVLFKFRKEAMEAHFAPCKYCLPPVWWSVHGVILPNKNNIPDKAIPE